MRTSDIDALRDIGLRKLALSVCALALFAGAPPTDAVAATCTPTGFFRDTINLTAALINPGHVSGDVDATGCNIGVYYSSGVHGHVENANVHGANYFGIVNNGAHVEVEDSTISGIGEKPFNGTQHGVAIYWAIGSSAKGSIHGNYVWNYQKGGIVVNGANSSADIRKNTVIGLGPVSFIAQNGIQAGYGADTEIKENTVVGNSYTGAGQTSSGGILLVGGDCYGGPPHDQHAGARQHRARQRRGRLVLQSRQRLQCGLAVDPQQREEQRARQQRRQQHHRQRDGALPGRHLRSGQPGRDRGELHLRARISRDQHRRPVRHRRDRDK